MLGTSSAAGLWARRETIRSVNFVDTTVKRGEIYYADLSPVVGSEQGGVRPVLIVQNDTGNRHLHHAVRGLGGEGSCYA